MEIKEIIKNRSEVDDFENESIFIENINGLYINMLNDNEGSGIVFNEVVLLLLEYFDEFLIDFMKSLNYEINVVKIDENILVEIVLKEESVLLFNINIISLFCNKFNYREYC